MVRVERSVIDRMRRWHAKLAMLLVSVEDMLIWPASEDKVRAA